MKKILITLAACAIATCTFGQQIIYTVVYNRSPEGRNFPVMIGGLNVADGDNTGVQIGLGNLVGGRQQGLQIGIGNAVRNNVRGAQFGVINGLGADQQGALFGVFNAVAGDVRGAQFGVLNAFGGNSSGAQFGVINVSPGMYGAQFGVLNFQGETYGAQFGVINATGSMEGIQFGVVNLVGRYERGIPVGLLNIIGEGGYQAVEVATSSLFPVNVSFKSGLEQFYTSIILAWNPQFNKPFSMGAGLGSLMPVSERVFFNPELNYLSTLGKKSASLFELHPNFGYRIDNHFSVIAAPTFSWQNVGRNSELNEPFYSLWSDRIDSRNELYLGLRFAIRYNFEW